MIQEETIQCAGIPGAENFKKEFVQYFEKFRKIYIHNEGDEAGQKFVDTISNLMPNEEIYEISARQVDIECKDPCDLEAKKLLDKETLLATAKKIEKKPKVSTKSDSKVKPKANKNKSKFKNGDEEEIALHVEIAEEVMNILYIHHFHGSFYVYSEGVYTENKELIENVILEINPNAKRNLREEILQYIRIKTFIKEKELDTRYINFKNGLFDIEKEQLIDHTPEIFNTTQVAANYMPNDKIIVNQYINKFLDDITSNNLERKKAILQMTGYSLTLRTDFQLTFLLFGPSAGNGKSTLTELITATLKKENVSTVTMHKLEEDFKNAQVVDKLANIATEIERKSIERMEAWKAITTGDLTLFNRKYHDPFSATAYCKMIFATNYLPEFRNADDSVYRRLFIIKFDRKFTHEEAIKFDKSKILTQEAIDYFANVALRQFLKIKNTRKLANEEESKMLLEQCKIANNSIDQFLGDQLQIENIFANSNKIPRPILYKKYVEYCKENGLNMKNRQDFNLQISMNENYREFRRDGYNYVENVFIEKDGAKEKPVQF